MRSLRRIICLAALFLPGVSAAGATTDSIEWMAARADVVLTGTITNIRRETLTTVAVEVQVTRTLKGTTGRHITFVYSVFDDPKGTAPAGWRGEQLFFFLRGVDIPAERRHDPAAWERLTLIMHEVNFLSLDDLKRSPAISCTFGTLTDIDEIADAIRSAPAAPAVTQQLDVRVPPGSPAFDALGRDPTATLRIPAGDRWKLPYLQYITRTPHWWDLVKNPRPLKTPETVEFMTKLLDDGTWECAHAANWNCSITSFETREYVVRQAACKILALWGSFQTAPTLQEPLLPRQPFLRELFFLPLLLVPLLVFPRRVPLPRRLWNLVTLIAAVAVLVICFMAVRSRFHYDDVIFATPAGEHEISSFQGRLQYLYVHDQPTPHDVVIGSTSLRDPRAVPDHIGYLYPATASARLGVEHTTGLTPPLPGFLRPSPMSAFAYRLTRIRYSTLLVAALLIPCARLIALLLRRGTSRRRRLRNLCINCGYDLRSSPDRCPECGKR